jgi:hypothetical protein
MPPNRFPIFSFKVLETGIICPCVCWLNAASELADDENKRRLYEALRVAPQS